MGSIYDYFFPDKSESESESEETEETKTDSPLIVNVKHIQYLYEFEIKDNDDFNLKKTDSKIELNIEESNKISESEKRSVYKGKIDDVKDCVVKTYKKNNGEVYYSIKDLFNDLINFFKAKKLSEKYAEKYQNDTEFIPMNFVDFYIGYEKENSTDELKGILSNVNSNYSKIGEGLNLIENFIERKKFRIFVNEYCQVNHTDSKNIPLFMHWNWVETNGTFLVCDLRGEINEDNKGFELSSPSLQSKDKIYGNSDNGVYSLITFIAEHKHTEHCKDLPWPRNEYIEKAKMLKNKYISSDKCDGCEETYDEIISSVFNTNINYFLIFLTVVFLLIINAILYNCIKKICSCDFYNDKDEMKESKLIIYSTEEINKPPLIG